MPRNGSGTFTRSAGSFGGGTLWQDQAASTLNLFPSLFDAHDQDIADAITASLAKDGQTTPTANLPMGGFRHTGVGAASALNHYGVVSQIQNHSYVFAGTSGGSANAQTISVSPAPSAYVAGQRFIFIAGYTNTAPLALNVNGIGNQTVRKRDDQSVDLDPGDVVAGAICEVVYDGSFFRLLSPENWVVKAWSPSYGATGAMTFTGITTSRARYSLRGKICHIELSFSGTTGGTASTGITATLPAVAVNGTNVAPLARIFNPASSTIDVGIATIGAGSNSVTFQLSGGANWGLGAARGAEVIMDYEVA